MTIGLPASGKSTWAKDYQKKHKNVVIIERDELRKMFGDTYKNPRAKHELIVTKMQREGAKQALESGFTVIISDTNLNPGRNKYWKHIAEKYDVEYSEKLFTDVPVGVCIERDACRENSVGQNVIVGMYNRYKEFWWNTEKFNSDLPGAYIFDIDGTLAKINGRSPHDFSKVGEDLPNVPVVEMCKILKQKNNIIIMSGRSSECREETEKWLIKHGIEYDMLVMRAEDDYRRDSIVKGELYNEHVKGNYNILGVFDDRDQVVHMWREKGFTVFQVDYGKF